MIQSTLRVRVLYVCVVFSVLQIEAQMLKLKEMVTTAHSQMQSHHERVYILDSTRSTHLLHMDKIEEERRKAKYVC